MNRRRLVHGAVESGFPGVRASRPGTRNGLTVVAMVPCHIPAARNRPNAVGRLRATRPDGTEREIVDMPTIVDSMEPRCVARNPATREKIVSVPRNVWRGSNWSPDVPQHQTAIKQQSARYFITTAGSLGESRVISGMFVRKEFRGNYRF